MTATQAVDPEVDAVRRALEGVEIESLTIDVVDNCVHMRGVAMCYDAKREAGERAQAAAPRACIANELRVSQISFAEDTDVAAEIHAAIGRAGVTGGVDVDVQEGVAHLRGLVRTAAERDAIEKASWEARGVSRVLSHLRVASAPSSDRDIERALEEYVRRAMNLSPGVVRVDYEDGIVVLAGAVSSTAQAQAIEDLVRWHERVRDVVNELRTGPAAAHSEAGRVS